MKKIKSLLLLIVISCFTFSAFAGEITFKVKPEALGLKSNQFVCDYTVHLIFQNSFHLGTYAYPDDSYYEQYYKYWVTDGNGQVITIPVNGATMTVTVYNPDNNHYSLTLPFYSGTTYQYFYNWEEGFPVPRSYSSYDWHKTRINYLVINSLSVTSIYGYSICPETTYITALGDLGSY